MAKSTATLTDNETGKTYEMPIIHGTIEGSGHLHNAGFGQD